MTERDKVHIGVIMRFSDFICLSFVRSFVGLSVDVRNDFFFCTVRPTESPYIRKKNTSFFFLLNTHFYLPCLRVSIYLSFYVAASGTV